jgi:hypothetical protein
MNAALGQHVYFLRLHPWEGTLLTAFLAQVGITAVILALWPLARKLPFLHWWILLACLVPGAYAARALMQVLPFDLYEFRYGFLFWPAVVASVGFFGFSLFRNPVGAAKLARQVLLHAWPVLLLVYVNAAWQMWGRTRPSDFRDGALAARVQESPRRPRVVWIVFDELSRVATERSSVFRAFAGNAVRALHAQPTASMTEVAMPSLIQGRIVKAVKRSKPNEMTLDEEGNWGQIPNVFDDARHLGRNTGLAGWYHPYCRILNQSLNACAWEPAWQPTGSEEMLWSESPLLDRFKVQARAFPLGGKHLSLANFPREHHAAIIRNLVARGREMARDPKLGLVLLHLPVPHPPNVFDRRTGRMSDEGSFSYLDSVALTERILRDLLDDLKASGLDQDTTVIVSADHGLRSAFWRAFPAWTAEDEEFSRLPGIEEIPFIVRLPGGQPGIDVAKPFNAVITRRLIDGILSGRLQTARQIADFVEAPVTSTPS